MNRLVLGTVQFGMPYGVANKSGQVTRLAAKAMLKVAKEKGICTLDTAIGYGESEICLGEAGITEFKLVTKIPAVPDDCLDVASWVQGQVNESFSRLGVSSVYGILLHSSSQLLRKNGQALYQALQNLKISGQVQKIGISIYSPCELEKLTHYFDFDLVQAPFNLFDHRLVTSGWLQKLKSKDIEVHTRSAFLQGLLLMSKDKIPAKFQLWSSLFDEWHEWLSQHSISAVQACLAYPLSFPEIDHVVVGADSVSQLEQIIHAAQAPMPEDLPDLHRDDESLINPALWSQL
jgi:aryl-alcohol dehydrogenase-like predicted oxidoreductase